jgi:site-specific recombinase XerD
MSAALIPVKLVPARRQGEAVAISSAFDAAFTDFLSVEVANGDASPETISSYRTGVAQWVGWCASQHLDLATATAADIKRFRQTLVDAGYKPVSVRLKLLIVRRFFDAARNAGLRTDNPAAGVKSPRIRHATEDFKYLSDDQLAKLLAAVPDPNQAAGPEKIRRLRSLLLMCMMALQGLRTIEVRRANVEDLTEKSGNLVLLVRGKTRDRFAYLRPDAAKRMKEYLALCGLIPRDEAGTPLFPSVGRGNKRLSRRSIRLDTDKYLRLAGLKRPGISNHALRHTAGTLGYLHTGDLRAVQDFLGHADPRMTARYAHVVDMAKKNPALFIPVKARRRA